MRANEKYSIRVGSMLSGGENEIYRVTSFVFSNGFTSKYGESVEDNVVHVDVYRSEDLKTVIYRKDFVHLNFVEPVVIEQRFLEAVGFRFCQLDIGNVLCYDDFYFSDLVNVSGFYTLRRISDNQAFPVQYVHEVQMIVANES